MMMEYGHRISRAEYDARVQKAKHTLTTTTEQEDVVSKECFFAKIDHRLGENFPLRRRTNLWLAHKVGHKKIKKLIKFYKFVGRLAGQRTGAELFMKALRLSVFNVYGGLSVKEQRMFFGVDDWEDPPLTL